MSEELMEKKASISSLLDYKKELQIQMRESEGDISEDLLQTYTLVENLISGKVDKICEMRSGLEEGIKDCKKQIIENELWLKKIEEMSKLAIEKTEGKRIDGISHSISIRKNAPSLEIIDESKVPDKFKVVNVELKDKFSLEDKKSYRWYQSVVLKKKIQDDTVFTKEEEIILAKSLKIEVPKNPIKEALKNKEVIDGVKLTSSETIQYKSGKSKKAHLKSNDVLDVIDSFEVKNG